MGMDLAVKTFSTAPEYLIAGPAEIATKVKKTAAALKRGAPVILGADGNLKAVTENSGAVSVEGLYGILAEDAGAGEDGIVYLSGEFFADGLSLEKNVTAAALESAFRNIGIYLR